MGRFGVVYATVASGFQASGAIGLAGADLFGLWAPTVTSCTLTLRGSFDSTSANFIPLTNPAGSGDWIFAVGPGSRAVTLQDVAFPAPFLKLFTSVAQTDTRTFAIFGKL